LPNESLFFKNGVLGFWFWGVEDLMVIFCWLQANGMRAAGYQARFIWGHSHFTLFAATALASGHLVKTV